MAEQERRFDDVCAWTDSCALAGAMAATSSPISPAAQLLTMAKRRGGSAI